MSRFLWFTVYITIAVNAPVRLPVEIGGSCVTLLHRRQLGAWYMVYVYYQYVSHARKISSRWIDLYISVKVMAV